MVAVTTPSLSPSHWDLSFERWGDRLRGVTDLLKDSARAGIVEVQAQAWGSATVLSVACSCLSNSGTGRAKVSAPSP